MMNLLVVFLVGFLFPNNLTIDNPEDNRSCSVVCLDDNWIPESYNVDAACVMNQDAKGVLSVHETFDVSDRNDYNIEEFIKFRVAIFKKDFNTMVSFSDQTYSQLDAEEVLTHCQTGDEIIIILTDPDKYSLPHHRISVQ